LEQLRIWQLAAGGVLATDHSDEPEVGSDESLPGMLSARFEESQFLIGRIGKPSTRYSGIPCQQARLDRALQRHNLCTCQHGLGGLIVARLSHADTVR